MQIRNETLSAELPDLSRVFLSLRNETLGQTLGCEGLSRGWGCVGGETLRNTYVSYARDAATLRNTYIPAPKAPKRSEIHTILVPETPERSEIPTILAPQAPISFSHAQKGAPRGFARQNKKYRQTLGNENDFLNLGPSWPEIFK